jgi:hypothetical protein
MERLVQMLMNAKGQMETVVMFALTIWGVILVPVSKVIV